MPPDQRYLHLDLARLVPAPPRRRGGGGGVPLRKHDNVRRHGDVIERELDNAETALIARKPPQFDPGLMVKLRIQAGTLSEDALRSFGIDLVSEESDESLIVFVSENAKHEFLRRLERFKAGETGHGVSANVFHAIEEIGTWSRQDRTGRGLAGQEWAADEIRVVDIELWPRDSRQANDRERHQTAEWITQNGGEVWDSLALDSVVLMRAQVTGALLDMVLDLETVRSVEPPPVMRVEAGDYAVELGNLVITGPDPDNAVRVAILDSGIISGHPLIGEACGEEISFVAGVHPADETGHGTAVAGFALYGDVGRCVQQREFVTGLQVLSGKVLTGLDNQYDRRLIASQVVDAVEYFTGELGCRIFNISFGDMTQPYDGRHVKGLAAVLDELARTRGVVFIVSAGNFNGTEDVPANWREEYPDYLFSNEARIIDPAPALNALTVGSLARYDQDVTAGRYPRDVNRQPLARVDELSPFTRTGPGPNRAIKPDLVEYGGNVSVDLARGGEPRFNADFNISEIALKHSYVGDRLFTPVIGTSFATPKVTNLAGRVLSTYPDASANLLRALMLLHAKWPEAAAYLFDGQEERGPELGYYSFGYGRPNPEDTVHSLENCVTLVAEERLGHDQTHFFEIPLPEDFLALGRGERFVRVALAHCPPCRPSRKTYKGSKISFKVVVENDLDTLARRFSQGSNLDNIAEWAGFAPGSQLRSKGTAMASTKKIAMMNGNSSLRQGKRLYVVVTHQVEGWATDLVNEQESYALAVALDAKAMENVRLYTQLRAMLRERVRARA